MYDDNGITRALKTGGGSGNVPKIIQNFEFPEKQELKLKLKDILEKEVDEKYYLKDYQIERIKKSSYCSTQRRIQEKQWCDTLCARDWKDPKCVVVGKLDIKGHDCIKKVYSDNGISPTLTNMQGGNRQPKVTVTDEKIVCEQRTDEGLRFFKDDVCGTIRTIQSGGDKRVIENSDSTDNNFRIRKLTPKECWRLMGRDDEDIDKCIAVGMSNTQLYKQAGNSIVVNVLVGIFKELLKEE